MRLSVGLCVVTLVVVLACTDLTGPVADLNTIGSDLSLIDGVLASPIPWSAAWAQYGLHLPVPDSGAPRIPDSLRGRTFTLDCATYSYALAPDTGAPATAVRIVLYRRDPNGAVPCPAVAIGHFDLFDVSTTRAPAIHAVATDNAGDLPAVDYTITRTGVGSYLTTGFVGDGVHRLGLDLFTNDSILYIGKSNWQVDVIGTGVEEVLTDTIFHGVDTYSDDLVLELKDGPRGTEVAAGYGVFNTMSSWGGKLSVDAAPFANISGTYTTPVFTPATPRERFTSTERQLLLQVLNEPATLHTSLGGMLTLPMQVLPR